MTSSHSKSSSTSGTRTLTEAIRLDAEQEQAAAVEPRGRQIVLAPPGSGKTEVVAALIEHLMDGWDLSASDEILVISFSRAAVTALHRRFRAQGVTPAVAVKTLDALAAGILAEGADGEWQELSFDERVSSALSLVGAQGLPDDLRSLRHVVVDEVQDLVGVRADLVLALLTAAGEDVGFTLLGDPRQAVYGFQLDGTSGLTSQEFLNRARQLGEVREAELFGSYRAHSSEARGAAAIGRDVPEGDERVTLMRGYLADLLAGGPVESLNGAVKRWRGSTAFLCRTNGEALVVAGTLREQGVAASLRAPAEELPIASWVGDALTQVPAASVKRSDVGAWLGPEAPPSAEAWRLLKSVERDFRSPDRLDIARLAAGLARGIVPIDLQEADSSVLVSTVHRAKGLEFDNVVVVNAGELVGVDATEDDAAVAYVAVTRARDRLLGARCQVPRSVHRDKSTDRWLMAGHQRWMTFGFEVRGIDADMTYRGVAPRDERPVIGAPVRGEVNPRLSSMEAPVYDLICEGAVVARTNERFGELLARRLRGPRGSGRPWPELSGLAVDGAGTAVDLMPPTGESMFGIAVRVSGLARLVWTTEEPV